MRRYTILGENMTVGTGLVLAAFQTAATVSAAGRIDIRRVEITQSGSTTSAQIRAAFSTRDTAGTLTTSTVTPAPFSPVTGPASGLSGNTSVIGGTARVGINSSADSGGAYTNHFVTNFNNLCGYLWVPTPEEIIVVPPSTVWCVRLLATPATTTGWTILVVYDEAT
jgi:hypothetical protein